MKSVEGEGSYIQSPSSVTKEDNEKGKNSINNKEMTSNSPNDKFTIKSNEVSIGKSIGRGAFGEVFLGRWANTEGKK